MNDAPMGMIVILFVFIVFLLYVLVVLYSRNKINRVKKLNRKNNECFYTINKDKNKNDFVIDKVISVKAFDKDGNLVMTIKEDDGDN